MSERIVLRPVVRRFAEAMERMLRANEHKGGWSGEDPSDLLEHAGEELEELVFEVRRRREPTGDRIRDEAADLANLAMMVADRCGALSCGSIIGHLPLDLSQPTVLIRNVGLVSLWDPKPEHILPERMARALSREGRYANQGDLHYSVAEHSWLVSMLCHEAPLQGLVHDLTEAILGDMIGPLRQLLRLIEGTGTSAFDFVEERWWHAVADRFGVPREMHPRVEYVDKALRVVERHVLFPGDEHHLHGLPGVGPNWLVEESARLGLREPLAVRCLPAEQACGMFMSRLRELGA